MGSSRSTLYAKLRATAFRNHVVLSILKLWRTVSILSTVYSSSRRMIALFDFFMYVSVDSAFAHPVDPDSRVGYVPWMYLDVKQTLESGVCVRWYDMVVRRGVDRIQIHAIITLDA